MLSPIMSIVTIISAIACCLVAGVFLSFSDFVMRSLDKSAPEARVEAMQHINREVFRTIFMVLLIGMSVASPILVVTALLSLDGVAAHLIIVGGAIYILSVFVVTMLGNVPMNMRLDRLDPDSEEAASYWTTFYPRWTLFNHLRTFGAAAAGVCFLLACVVRPQV